MGQRGFVIFCFAAFCVISLSNPQRIKWGLYCSRLQRRHSLFAGEFCSIQGSFALLILIVIWRRWVIYSKFMMFTGRKRECDTRVSLLFCRESERGGNKKKRKPQRNMKTKNACRLIKLFIISLSSVVAQVWAWVVGLFVTRKNNTVVVCRLYQRGTVGIRIICAEKQR